MSPDLHIFEDKHIKKLDSVMISLIENVRNVVKNRPVTFTVNPENCKCSLEELRIEMMESWLCCVSVIVGRYSDHVGRLSPVSTSHH